MIPLRATDLKMQQQWPNHIIIHHTAEFAGDHPRYKFDTQKFQSGDYLIFSRQQLKQKETMYHFIIERFKNDFNIIVSQPMMTICEYRHCRLWLHLSKRCCCHHAQ